MEKLYSVYEMGTWEYWGSHAECVAYVNRHAFSGSFFVIKEA